MKDVAQKLINDDIGVIIFDSGSIHNSKNKRLTKEYDINICLSNDVDIPAN